MAPAPDLAPGEEIFGYRIERRIGRGGMGTVYLAQQLSLGRQVALKVLHPERIRRPQQVEAFLREARQAGRLNHPHLLLVHAVHEDSARGLYCYAMEYVAGRTLTALVKEQGRLTANAALHVGYQVAKALGYAHRQGMVHRDVKPDNILITPPGVAKLADLGLARDLLEGISPQSSKILSIVGTPAFSAPEQSRNPSRATAASDIWSLGATLFACTAGKPPFTGETVIDLIVRTATEAVAYPEDMDPRLRGLLERMLAVDVDDRYADGDEVVAALETIAAGTPPPEPRNRTRTEEVDDEDAPPAAAAAGGGSGSRPTIRRRRRRR